MYNDKLKEAKWKLYCAMYESPLEDMTESEAAIWSILVDDDGIIARLKTERAEA